MVPRSRGRGGSRGGSSRGKGKVPKERTGSEAAYLRYLVDSRQTVVVTLRTGERLKGRIRYYDTDCFSLGLADQQKKLFLRKASVLSIQEE